MKTILEEDARLLKARILELERQLFELGEEFNEAVNQSSETWHDNAPFDVARDKQSLINAERKNLLHILHTHTIAPVAKKTTHCMPGVFVYLSHLPQPVYLAAHSTLREKHEDCRVVSIEAPLGAALYKQKPGASIELAGRQVVIEKIRLSL